MKKNGKRVDHLINRLKNNRFLAQFSWLFFTTYNMSLLVIKINMLLLLIKIFSVRLRRAVKNELFAENSIIIILRHYSTAFPPYF